MGGFPLMQMLFIHHSKHNIIYYFNKRDFMKKRLTLLFATLFLLIGTALAQKNVSGTVISSEDGLPVIGAAVKAAGSSVGTTTDLDGKFSFDLPVGETKVVISYVGMITQTLAASSGMNITLKPDSKNLEEVVVVGYGSAKKIGSLTGPVATVNSDKIKNAPSASVLDALQGQVAGLSVLSSSGVAGDNATSLSLHGIGSLGSSSTPLYVVDGIPTTSRSVMAMNPNDFKSVTILKDASSTSIYGSRAANGVIYITTKNGGFNSKATVTVRSQFGWNTLANKAFYEDFMSGDELYDFWKTSGLMSEAILNKRYDSNGYRYNTKWYEVFQQFNNPQTQNDITFEGGGDKVSYLSSVSQFHQKGTTIGNYYDRYTVRTNINARPKDWLRAGFNINLAYDKRQKNSSWGDSSASSNNPGGGLSYMLNPLFPSTDADGNALERYGFGFYNPEYIMSKRPDVYERYSVVGNTYVEIEPIKNLKIMSRIGTDLSYTRDNWLTYPSYIPANGNGARGKSTALQYSHTITNTIEYSFAINSIHHFTILGGQEGIKNNYDYYYALSTGQIVDGLMNLQNGKQANYSMKEEATASKFLSFFGRLNYNLKDRYFVDLSIRNDASSRFSANHRNATFWSVGFMWKLAKEKFMQPYKWVNDLNFKIDYGTQGNAAIGDYESLGLMTPGVNYNENGSLLYTQPQNAELTWETQKLFTVGFTGRLWNRFDFDISYYLRNTTDMLMLVPYAYTTGFSKLTSNVGSLRNSGIDIKLGVDIVRGKNYYVNAGAVFNYNKQTVTKLFGGKTRWEVANTGVAYVVGSPVMLYSPIYAGLNRETGAPMWYKAGANVDKTTKEETTEKFDAASLTQNTGKKRYAPINGGFNIAAGYKGFSLAADFAYVLGKYLTNNDAYFYDNAAQFLGFNQRKDVTDYWTVDNKDAKYPNWAKGYQMQFDTHLLENASFLRLKNFQLGYLFDQKLLGFQNVVQTVKLTFTARNLFTITGYKGLDPEINSNVVLGRVGNTKQFLFGVELTF